MLHWVFVRFLVAIGFGFFAVARSVLMAAFVAALREEG
jgi:hypothetical protein